MLNWTAIYHDLFEVDDGALPGITISNLTGEEVIRIYSHLRSRGDNSSVNPHFWHKELQSDQPIDSVPNAAELVVSGQAYSFHHCVRTRATSGIEIPDLGIFVDPDCVALDYRRGPDWNPAKVEALFHLLFDVAQMAPRAKFTLEEEVGDWETVAFAKVWDESPSNNAMNVDTFAVATVNLYRTGAVPNRDTSPFEPREVRHAKKTHQRRPALLSCR